MAVGAMVCPVNYDGIRFQVLSPRTSPHPELTRVEEAQDAVRD